MFSINDTSETRNIRAYQKTMNAGLEMRQSAMKNAENQLTIMLLLVTTLF